jgi:hypothetical protein
MIYYILIYIYNIILLLFNYIIYLLTYTHVCARVCAKRSLNKKTYPQLFVMSEATYMRGPSRAANVV